ncbi:hypothetical protein JOD64_000656 [Micromonospora luteifusca]|uniref:Uncharacterized protein n=1 Tax=Micromonospora luteifusca TaxID=709860 RepID=A0ABS2LMM4_9ACTN|nr:hypothetical protein [Micromonospora luteifusca]MBM7489434.1 hypothetical protein [Micromonospora luteifusca]
MDEHSRRQPRQQVLGERVVEGDGWFSPPFIHCVRSPVRLVSVRL